MHEVSGSCDNCFKGDTHQKLWVTASGWGDGVPCLFLFRELSTKVSKASGMEGLEILIRTFMPFYCTYSAAKNFNRALEEGAEAEALANILLAS